MCQNVDKGTNKGLTSFETKEIDVFLLGRILTFHGTKWIREYTCTLQGTKLSLL